LSFVESPHVTGATGWEKEKKSPPGCPRRGPVCLCFFWGGGGGGLWGCPAVRNFVASGTWLTAHWSFVGSTRIKRLTSPTSNSNTLNVSKSDMWALSLSICRSLNFRVGAALRLEHGNSVMWLIKGYETYCAYNVTLRSVRSTNVTVEKQ